jgi:hypothetical protein
MIAFFFTTSIYRSRSKQMRIIEEIQLMKAVDIARMRALEKHWKELLDKAAQATDADKRRVSKKVMEEEKIVLPLLNKQVSKTFHFELQCKKAPQSEAYLLTVIYLKNGSKPSKDDPKYHFYVKKDDKVKVDGPALNVPEHQSQIPQKKSHEL